MTDHERIPLDKIAPSPRALDRILYGDYSVEERARQWAHNNPPTAPYEPDGYWEGEEDKETTYARTFLKAAESVDKTICVRGSLYPFTVAAFDATVKDWQQEYPGITATEVRELTKITDFADITIREVAIKRHRLQETTLAGLRPQHARRAAEIFRTYQTDLMEQTISQDLLDTPPYRPQASVMGCMQSCYAMVFEGIAGDTLKAPDQISLKELFKCSSGRPDEDLLFRSLSSELFRQKTGQIVTSRVIIGANFADIAQRAERVKQRIAGAAVFATVGIKNFDADLPTGLHGVMLLEVSDKTVTFHNPHARQHNRGRTCTARSNDDCGAYETLDKAEFAERWSASMHDTRLVIAHPDPHATESR